jgi:hypothetical protein
MGGIKMLITLEELNCMITKISNSVTKEDNGFKVISMKAEVKPLIKDANEINVFICYTNKAYGKKELHICYNKVTYEECAADLYDAMFKDILNILNCEYKKEGD